MEDGLKNNWKKVGKDFATLGKDFGKTLLKTVKTGVDAANDWAAEKDEKKGDTEVVTDRDEQAKADAAKPAEKV